MVFNQMKKSKKDFRYRFWGLVILITIVAFLCFGFYYIGVHNGENSCINDINLIYKNKIKIIGIYSL